MGENQLLNARIIQDEQDLRGQLQTLFIELGDLSAEVEALNQPNVPAETRRTLIEGLSKRIMDDTAIKVSDFALNADIFFQYIAGLAENTPHDIVE